MIRPEDFWEVDPEFAQSYARQVSIGRRVASELDACVVMIVRNAMPHLINTAMLLAEVRQGFRRCPLYVFENDSEDGSDEFLKELAAAVPETYVQHGSFGGADWRGGFDDARTNRLAACRNLCMDWVRRECGNTTWTIVLDADPHGGFSVDGVFNSIAWLSHYAGRAEVLPAGGMASYGVFRAAALNQAGRGLTKLDILGYDSWAARVGSWRDRRAEVGFSWFATFLPPVGAEPLPMLSCFNGLAVYRTSAFLSGGYAGGDCEHVAHHRRMREAGWQMFMNPGCRYVAY